MLGAALGHYIIFHVLLSIQRTGGKWQEGVRTRVSRPLRSLCSCFSTSPSSLPKTRDTAPSGILMKNPGSGVGIHVIVPKGRLSPVHLYLPWSFPHAADDSCLDISAHRDAVICSNSRITEFLENPGFLSAKQFSSLLRN